MVKEPGKAKKMKSPTYHVVSKPFMKKRFGKVDQGATPSHTIFSNKTFTNSPFAIDPDTRLVDCVKNVLKMLKIDTYVGAMEQLNHLYDYVMASISFGEYATVQNCSIDKL